MYPPWLTFRHWSGVTPYTSSYEFAGSCVFGKQLLGKLSLRPRRITQGTMSEVTKLNIEIPNKCDSAFRLIFRICYFVLFHHTLCDAPGQALSLTYGRFFAEFLEDLLLVHLGLLDLTTCVGLRYGHL